ncbi:hypothetical protein [Micromonospora sp. NBRC 101691]|uniref:hypothetical protein n=1 Tax=Micromonospora sp. NBRC 101691 TaxID=3032198 RepID=UPI0024A48D7F|nr:hypothetical protein [Micromonospora sp. NBRC 101691]GLY21696.1 hypothetical protein Misp04_14280 [Micromonospora sp. NBRC 101691]
MSNDPHRITRAQIEELLRGLGLDPVDLRQIMSIHMAGTKIEIVRARLDEAGRMYPVGNEIAAETVTIAIVP